jgi:hypothetical protein
MQNELADWVAFQLVRRLGVQQLEEPGLQALHLLSRRGSLYYVLLSTKELDAQNIRARNEAWREFSASRGSKVGAHVRLIYLLEEAPNRNRPGSFGPQRSQNHPVTVSRRTATPGKPRGCPGADEATADTVAGSAQRKRTEPG